MFDHPALLKNGVIAISCTVVIILIIVIAVVGCNHVKKTERQRVQREMSERYENQKLIDPRASMNPQVKFEEFLNMFDDQEMATEMKKLYIPARVFC